MRENVVAGDECGSREWWCVMSERLGGKVVSAGGERAVAYSSRRKRK